MKKTITIKNSGIFSKTIYRGKSISDKYLIVYVSKNNTGRNRIGISVGKKTGNSVERNRIKRLLKEAYRSLEDKVLYGFDIVFIPRKPSISKDIKMMDINESMFRLFKRFDIFKKDVVN